MGSWPHGLHASTTFPLWNQIVNIIGSSGAVPKTTRDCVLWVSSSPLLASGWLTGVAVLSECSGLWDESKGFIWVYLRLALGVSFLSAIADRFGLWGLLGKPNAAWGDFSHFIICTAKLNWFMPSATTPALAWGAT